MKAHELIENPEKWTKVYLCRDKNGVETVNYATGEDEPVCWCAWGAIIQCNSDKEYSSYSRAIDKLRCAVKNIPEWNDASDYQTVYKTLRDLDI